MLKPNARQFRVFGAKLAKECGCQERCAATGPFAEAPCLLRRIDTNKEPAFINGMIAFLRTMAYLPETDLTESRFEDIQSRQRMVEFLVCELQVHSTRFLHRDVTRRTRGARSSACSAQTSPPVPSSSQWPRPRPTGSSADTRGVALLFEAHGSTEMHWVCSLLQSCLQRIYTAVRLCLRPSPMQAGHPIGCHRRYLGSIAPCCDG